MKKNILLLILAFVVMSCALSAQDITVKRPAVDLYQDTWVATDALGRTMPGYDAVGPVKTDQRRVVGIFYITWHTQNLATLPGPYGADVTKVLNADPNARLQADNPNWKYGSYHWGGARDGLLPESGRMGYPEGYVDALRRGSGCACDGCH